MIFVFLVLEHGRFYHRPSRAKLFFRAQLLQSKINQLKERNHVGVEEMQTRINLVEAALHELRAECEETVRIMESDSDLQDGGNGTGPTSAKKSLAKLNQLRGILCFLRAQLNAAIFDDDDRRPSKAEKEAAEKLTVMRHQLLSEQENVCACMMDVVQVLENDAQLVQTQVDKLKASAHGDVEEMETRLQLVEVGLRRLRLECEETATAIDGEASGEIEVEDITEVNPTNAKESLATVHQLRKILFLLSAELDVAMAEESECHPTISTQLAASIPASDAENTNKENVSTCNRFTHEETMTKPDDVQACLDEIILVQNDAQEVQSKVNVLKQSNSSGVDKIEVRLKMTMKSISALRSECEQKDNAMPVNTRRARAKTNQLRVIVHYLLSQVSGDMKTRNQAPQQDSDILQECLRVIISVQDDAQEVQSKVNALKESNSSGVEEMEVRLNMAMKSISDLRSELERADDTIKSDDIVNARVKTNQLSGIIQLLLAQVSAAVNGDMKTTKQAPQQGSDELDACLREIISVQDDAQEVQSKVNVLKESNSSGVEEMEVRLNMAMKSISDLRSECEQTDHAMKPDYIAKARAKTNQLSGIIQFLLAQVRTAEDGDMKTTKQAPLQDDESEACLREIISVQDDAQQLQSKVNVLKESSSSGVEEMEVRLNMAMKSISDLRSECEQTDHAMKPDDIAKARAKTNQLSGIIQFLLAQVRTAEAGDMKTTKQAPLQADESEACLREIISVQDDAQQLQSKVNVLKESSSSGVEEMEARLKMAMKSISALRSECEQTDDAIKPDDIAKTRAKTKQLSGIIQFLLAQVRIAADGDMKTTKQGSLQGSDELEACLTEIISVQHDAQEVQSKVNVLRESNSSGVDEMEVRLKMAIRSISELRSEWEHADDGIKPDDIAKAWAKTKQLGEIVKFLLAQVSAAVDGDMKTREQPQQECSDELEACLREIVSVQDIAQEVQSKVNVLKESNSSGVEEMEARLKMAMKSISALRSECEQTDDAMQSVEIQKTLPKVKQLRGIVHLLLSQVSAAVDRDVKTRKQVLQQDSEGLDACLREIISIQDIAQEVQSKVNVLKESNSSGAEEMEVRLKMATKSISVLRSECEQTGDATKLDNIAKAVAKTNQLRGIVKFLLAQVSAAVDGDIQTRKQAPLQGSRDSEECLREIISVQDIAQEVQSKVNVLKESNSSGVEEMEVRLKMAMKSILDLRSEWEQPDDGSKAHDIAKARAKTNQLWAIVKFLLAQLSAAVDGNIKTTKQAPLQRSDELEACLREIISVQDNAEEAQSKVNVLKESNSSGVEEMEVRLKMVMKSISALRSECEQTDDDIQPADIQKTLAKVNQLRGIIEFLLAQISAVVDGGIKTREQAPKHDSDELEACLREIISVQDDAQEVQSKVSVLKESNSSGVEEMEVRLKMAMKSISDLRSECEQTDDAIHAADIQKTLAKVNQLRGIVQFLTAQVSAAVDMDTKTSKHAPLQSSDELDACLREIMSVQDIAQEVQSKVNLLKESTSSGVAEMEVRLEIARNSISALRSECEQTDDTIHTAEIQRTLAKVNQLRRIVEFIMAQVSAAIDGDIKTRKQAPLKDSDELDACLREIMLVQDIAQEVQSKVNLLKESNSSGVEEMEVRLKMAKKSISALRSECEHTDDTIHAAELQKTLAKVNQLRGIVQFLMAQVSAAVDGDIKTNNHAPLQCSDELDACLREIMSVQDIAQEVQSKVNLLKESSSGVEEMEVRLKMARRSISDLRSECEQTEDTTHAAEIQKTLAKVNQLRRIVLFLLAQVSAAVDWGVKTRKQAQQQDSDELDACFREIISVQDIAQEVQSKVDALKGSNSSGVEEMEVRLKMAMKSISDLRLEWEQADDAIRLGNIARARAKTNQLRGIVQCLVAQVSAAVDGDMKTRNQAPQQGSDELEGCLREIISVQDNAEEVQSKVNVLKDSNSSGVEEMEVRLKMARKSISAFRSECEQTDEAIHAADIQKTLAKVDQLRGIVQFLMAQVNAAVNGDMETRKKGPVQDSHKLDACLRGIISVQHNAEEVQSKVKLLKESNSSGVEEMEVRLRMTMRSISALRSECEQTDDAIQLVEIQKTLAKVSQLRGIVQCLLAQVSVAVDGHIKTSKQAPLQGSDELDACLREIISVQDVAQEVQSKVDALKESNSSGVEEMEVRLKLATKSSSDLRLEWEQAVDGIKPDDIARARAKTSNLRGIVQLLLSQVSAAIDEDMKKTEQAPLQGCDELQGFLREIISVQDVAQDVQSKVNVLKESNSSGIEEMEVRLKMAMKSISDFRSEWEQVDDAIKPDDITKARAKTNQLRRIVQFVLAQVNAVITEDVKDDLPKADVRESAQIQAFTAKEAEKNAMESVREQLLAEQENASACLMEVITFEERRAQLVRSKLQELKGQGCTGVLEMETRLGVAEVALNNLRSECKASNRNTLRRDDGAAELVDVRKILQQVTNLRGIIGLLDSQLDVAISVNSAIPDSKSCHSETKIEVKSKELSVEVKTRESTIDELKKLLGFQHEEMVRLRTILQRKDSVVYGVFLFLLRAVFYGSLLTAIIHGLRAWESSMTPFNIVCAPALPGARITEQSGVAAAPFWIPSLFKEFAYNQVCGDVPRVRLEIKDQHFVVTEISLETNAVDRTDSIEQRFERRNGLFSRTVPVEKIRRYPARFAYITLRNIVTVDSDGWHEIPLPWASSEEDEEEIARSRHPRSRRYDHINNYA